MKHILLALLLAFTTSSVANAQKQVADTTDTAVTVVSIDKADATSAEDENVNFPFSTLEDSVSEGILVSIIAIVAVFGLPVFILFVIFFFRYKNRKARYHLAEQALAAGHPLPENFLQEKHPTDQRSQGIRNTFTGIGLFIFLWTITENLGIGTIGLLVMFTGIGQWIIGSKEQPQAGNSNGEDSDFIQ